MDGANMNAQVGLCRPGDYGADVCHLNLHKTFCIPHGGGGPGVGPIGVAKHLVPISASTAASLESRTHAISTSTAIGRSVARRALRQRQHPDDLVDVHPHDGRGRIETKRREVAILNANYIAKRLDPYFPVLFKGKHGLVAHECILDLRAVEERRHRSGRRREAFDGLRLSRADDFLAGRRHDDGRTDRERTESTSSTAFATR